MTEPDLQAVGEYLDDIPTDFEIQGRKEDGYAGLLERMRNDLLAQGGGRITIHDAEHRVVHCEDVGADGEITPVPEESWYDFLEDD